jgi:pilus assembly protein Flp/PilA
MLLQIQSAISHLIANLRSREEGQGMVEYGLILALVAVVVALALTPLGSTVSDLISNVTSKL